ncbi:DCC family protein At1g52590 [Seminavis robusta]|uniref:DCC family protein At1g52590 n=1 Tax=Seminavis robusta TaxID=568900 RepID=A0A9N8HMU7_9STRA|nr:DCC family protein At1g52590 [Seminavis robusta]|eukprot:Sro1151_g246770.1 DCC family protein At1g52590 (234) ;mRNA; f:24370-25166
MLWRIKALWLACLSGGRWSQFPLLPVVSASASRSPAFVSSRRSTRSFATAASNVSTSSGSANGTTESSFAMECDEPTLVAQRVFATDKRPVILFDGVCNMCNGAVNLALDWDPKGKLRFSALQSNVGRALLQVNGRAANDISSIVLVTEDSAFIKSDAILRITEALTPLRLVALKPAAVVARWVVPRFLRDIVYDGVAVSRYNILGKQDQCRFDADGEFEDRFVDDRLAQKQV